MEFLALLVLAVVFLVILPVMAIGLFFKGLVLLIMLPFRLLGMLLGLIAGIFGGLAKVAVSGFAFLFFVGAIAAAILFLPLIPLFLLFGLIWLVARLGRRPAPAVHRAP